MRNILLLLLLSVLYTAQAQRDYVNEVDSLLTNLGIDGKQKANWLTGVRYVVSQKPGVAARLVQVLKEVKSYNKNYSRFYVKKPSMLNSEYTEEWMSHYERFSYIPKEHDRLFNTLRDYGTYFDIETFYLQKDNIVYSIGYAMGANIFYGWKPKSVDNLRDNINNFFKNKYQFVKRNRLNWYAFRNQWSKDVSDRNIKSWVKIISEDIARRGGGVSAARNSAMFKDTNDVVESLVENIIIRFDTFEDRTIAKGGRTDQDVPLLIIDADRWIKLSELQKVYVMYHELGHAFFRLGHDGKTDLMFPVINDAIQVDEFMKIKDEFIDYIIEADSHPHNMNWADKYKIKL